MLIPETIDLGSALTAVRAAVAEQPLILKEPAPTVLLDRSAPPDNALQIVVGFSAVEADIPLARSALIQAIQGALAPSPVTTG